MRLRLIRRDDPPPEPDDEVPASVRTADELRAIARRLDTIADELAEVHGIDDTDRETGPQ